MARSQTGSAKPSAVTPDAAATVRSDARTVVTQMLMKRTLKDMR